MFAQFKKQQRDVLKSNDVAIAVPPVTAQAQECMLSNWDASSKQFCRPWHDAMFDPLKDGANTGGPLRGRSRTFPFNLLTAS